VTAEWITAISTLVTAVLTGTGGLAAWLALRRESKRDLPIVEREMTWRDDHILLSLTFRNRTPETLILERVEVLWPRRSTISEPYGSREVPYGDPGPPQRGASRTMITREIIGPAGAIGGAPHMPRETTYTSFAIWPPPGWRSGVVTVALRISSKADAMCNKRIVLKSRIADDASRQTDANANISG